MAPASPLHILVTGADGQVGRALARQDWPDHCRLTYANRAALDITDADAVRALIASGGVGLVVNAAAYTAVDRAETEPAAADAGNRLGPEVLAYASGRAGIPLIHISTDYVFDGSKAGAYVEDDPVAPLGVYGASKEAGERAVRQHNDRHLILRTAWVYSADGGNFIKTMLRLAGERDSVSVVDDQIGCPSSADAIANAIVALTTRFYRDGDATAWGTYHLCCAGETSWHGFAAAIFEALAARGGKAPALSAIKTKEFPTPARRPANSVLNCDKLKTTFGITPPHWQEALIPVMDELCGKPERGD